MATASILEENTETKKEKEKKGGPADPEPVKTSQCNSTNRPNPPIQKICLNFWTNDAILWSFDI